MHRPRDRYELLRYITVLEVITTERSRDPVIEKVYFIGLMGSM